MFNRTLMMLALAATFAGCATTGYSLVQPGINNAGGMQVTAGSGWNIAPAVITSGARKGTQLWTRDGIYLDRLVLIPAVADGEPLLTAAAKDAALPVFRKDMLPNEVEELMESTLVKYFGEGNAAVSTANLRPQVFGSGRGVMFDIDARLTDSPTYKGRVGAFIVDDKLYTIWYIAADPYYFDKHNAVAEAVITSARVAAP